MQKIQDGRHLVQNKVSLQGMLKNESVALFPGQLQANFPEKKQIHNFLHIFFLTSTHIKEKLSGLPELGE